MFCNTKREAMKAIVFVLTLACVTISAIVAVRSTRGKGEITLCTICPPGFELTTQNICKLRTIYLQYESGHGDDPGVGGLKTALPPVRDGFSPQQIDLGRYLFLILYYRKMELSPAHLVINLKKGLAMD